MEPYKCPKLPVIYKKDDELLSLLADATEKYGEYKTYLKNMNFDSNIFLNSILLYEGLYSTIIEGTQITQDEMFYLDYKEKNDDMQEIINLREAIEFGKAELIKNNKINLNLVSNMHRILLKSVRGSKKQPGKIRTNQNFIGPTNSIEDATFVPPVPEEVAILLDNLFEFMNDKYIEPNIFINVAIAHAQFETIHPYSDGNGRLGRALIPLHLFCLKEDAPILFLSEVIEQYKMNYHNTLNKTRLSNYTAFIKFFLQCIIDQCNHNILRLNKITNIYNEDMKLIQDNLFGRSVFIIMPILMRTVVISTEKIVEETGMAKTTIIKTLNNLINLGILEKEKKEGSKRITYKYKRIYGVFVNNKF